MAQAKAKNELKLAPSNSIMKSVNNQKSPNPGRRPHRPYFGLLLALVSAFFITLSNLFGRKCVLLTASDISIVNYLVALIVMASLLVRNKQSLFGPRSLRLLLTLRAFFYALSILLILSSIKLIEPSNSTALFHTNVIILAVLSRIFFKEKLGCIHIFSLAISIIGN